MHSAPKDKKPHSGAAVSFVELWPWPPEICLLQQKFVLLCSLSRRLLRQPHGDGVATAAFLVGLRLSMMRSDGAVGAVCAEFVVIVDVAVWW